MKKIDYSKYKTDKVACHGYMPHYERIFADLRKKPIKLLEIGVMEGHCLVMWRDFFAKGSEIQGLDFHCTPLDREALKEIKVHDVDVLEWDTDEMYDIIIDDASHDAHEQIETIMKLWKNIKSGGIYVIEDVPYPDKVRDGLKDFISQPKVQFEEVEGDNPRLPDDRLFVFSRKRKGITSLTFWQKIVNMFLPSKGKKTNEDKH